ncbi:MAG TPA: CAP domain-containing protein [Acidimicrobiales bacterium]|nr:CAP domain-containing protein [Acidimicrobiales bacterium]
MRAVCRGLIVMLATTLALFAMPALTGTASADNAGDESAFVSRINSLRASKGLPALVVDVRLTDVARAWSASMAKRNVLEHNPNLSSQAPSTWQKLGENVGYGGSVTQVHDAFVNSPSHYRNLVDGAFNAVGIGVVWAGSRMWVTEVFMQGPAQTAYAAAPSGPGWYRLAGAGGEVHGFGTASGFTTVPTNSPIVAIAARKGGGYWQAAANGAVFASGAAPFFGSMAGRPLNSPIVGMAPTRTGDGYWLVGRDGGIFSFGDAQFFGSTGSMRLNQPVVGMTASPTGNGYWFVASDGGIFSFGDARFHGSTGSMRLNAPVLGMAATASGGGYWLFARDGGIFTFGDAPFFGSTGSIRLNQPVVGMTPTSTGRGYWFVASDGGIFTFGDASFLGSTGGRYLSSPIVGMIGGL